MIYLSSSNNQQQWFKKKADQKPKWQEETAVRAYAEGPS
jgi:hypothetical protein